MNSCGRNVAARRAPRRRHEGCLLEHADPARRLAACGYCVDGHELALGPALLGLREPWGGGPHRYTAPVQPASARWLVAAFNGGFIMNVAKGGYYAEGRIIDPLRAGVASLVIYADGSINVGAWGRDVRMTPRVIAVRQNLMPLVAGGRPTARAASADWQVPGARPAALARAPLACPASSTSGALP